MAYEDKRVRLKYPQAEPQIIALKEIISHEKQNIHLTVMIIVGKKYKKIAKGDINIYRKYFMNDKKPVQKWLTLTLFQTQLENMGHKSDIIKAEINLGKIQLDINFIDSIDSKKKTTVIKEPIQSNKSERFRSVVENSNEFLKKIKQKKGTEIMEELYEDIEPPEVHYEQFDDGLSDLSISIIDGEEDDKDGIELTELINDKFHNQLKELFDGDCEAILPKDPAKLKEMNEMLFTKFKELSESYEKTLTAMNISNERMRLQAKDFYEKYKEIKSDVYKERLIFRDKSNVLKNEISENKEKNKKLANEINELKTEIEFFKNKMNIQDENKSTTSPQVEDINSMSEILRSIHNKGYDIFSGLTPEQKKQLMALIEVEEHEGVKAVNGIEEINDKDDIILGNQIVALIEKVVNDLFPKNLIVNVKIDQINAVTYTFSDDNHSKEISLKITNGNLASENGESFNAWLISNFGKR